MDEDEDDGGGAQGSGQTLEDAEGQEAEAQAAKVLQLSYGRTALAHLVMATSEINLFHSLRAQVSPLFFAGPGRIRRKSKSSDMESFFVDLS